MSWEGEYGRSLSPGETVDVLRQAGQRQEDEAWRRAKALGLVTVVVVHCPQCWTVLEMPEDAMEAICGNCTACIGKDWYGGWWVKG